MRFRNVGKTGVLGYPEKRGISKRGNGFKKVGMYPSKDYDIGINYIFLQSKIYI